eukprot:TRINITY_DN7002_c0_g1_i1.p1 TRINITY_DN7002_c0_g1~~TRINITY_DN7002_c0_g1_i1.p1  ORF type:complete len:157 (+),score=64.09 TRINITY_DN7002_c0_g1_i1:23-472(+)
MTMIGLFPASQRFVNNSGDVIGLDALEGKTRLGIFFSAAWCPPCRGFTPKLLAAYAVLVADHPDFEIVFVTSDRDEVAFKEHLRIMPWLALPFGDPAIPALKKRFNVTGIPLLVVVDGSGHQITREARNLVHGDEPHHYRHVWARLAAP